MPTPTLLSCLHCIPHCNQWHRRLAVQAQIVHAHCMAKVLRTALERWRACTKGTLLLRGMCCTSGGCCQISSSWLERVRGAKRLRCCLHTWRLLACRRAAAQRIAACLSQQREAAARRLVLHVLSAHARRAISLRRHAIAVRRANAMHCIRRAWRVWATQTAQQRCNAATAAATAATAATTRVCDLAALALARQRTRLLMSCVMHDWRLMALASAAQQLHTHTADKTCQSDGLVESEMAVVDTPTRKTTVAP
jgi:hypothetical protein